MGYTDLAGPEAFFEQGAVHMEENRKVYDFGSESRDINVTLLYK